MEIVSGKTGTPHVTSQQFRQIIEGTIGQESYIITSGENLEPELVSNNVLKIRSGMMSHHGNVSSVKIGTYDEVELLNGSQNMKRIDLVVNRYTRNDETEIEKNSWVCIAGTPASANPVAPQYTEGNLQDGDLIDDCPVFEIHYDGLNVTEVKKLLSVAKNESEMQTLIAAAQNQIAELNRNLTTAQNQITTLNGNLTKAQNQIATLSGKLKILKTEYIAVNSFESSNSVYSDINFGKECAGCYIAGTILAVSQTPWTSSWWAMFRGCKLDENGRGRIYCVGSGFVNGHGLGCIVMAMK